MCKNVGSVLSDLDTTRKSLEEGMKNFTTDFFLLDTSCHDRERAALMEVHILIYFEQDHKSMLYVSGFVSLNTSQSQDLDELTTISTAKHGHSNINIITLHKGRV